MKYFHIKTLKKTIRVSIKPSIIILCCFLHIDCNYTKKIDQKNQINPMYAAQFERMQRINAKDVIISTLVKDTSGLETSITNLSKDYISVIKLWATWCSPCIETMPKFQKLKEQYQHNKKIRFYTVSIDHKFEHWKPMISKNDWKVDHYWAGYSEKSQINHLTYEIMDSIVSLVLPNYVILDEKSRVKENIVTNEHLDSDLKSILDKIVK